MKRFFLLLIILINFNSYAFNKIKIEKIKFYGFHRINPEEILPIINIKNGDFIDKNKVNYLIKMLYSTKNFDNIKILCEKNNLIIYVKENPLIGKIKFIGNKLINNSILKKNLDKLNIKSGSILNKINIKIFKKELKNYYSGKSKYNFKLKIMFYKKNNNFIDIHFIFNENDFFIIKKINFIGNNSFSSKKLLFNMQLNNNFLFSKEFKNKVFNKNEINLNLDLLKKFYLNKGYVKFNINNVEYILKKNKYIYINIDISEGKIYKYNGFNILGDIKIDNKILKNIININLNEKFNYNKNLLIIKKIEDMLIKYGYPKYIIKPKLKINNLNNTVNVIFFINPGKRFYVRKIIFQGNTLSKDVTLRRIIPQLESSLMNKYLIEKGRTLLKKLDYFNDIDIKIVEVPHKEDQVDVIYKISEKNTGKFNFTIGIGIKSGINFKSGINKNNIFGTGYYISSKIIKNDYQSNLDLSIYDPYLTIDGISLKEHVFYNKFNSKKADLSGYTNIGYGINNIFGFNIDINNLLNFGINYINNNISEIKPQLSMWRYLNSMNFFKNSIVKKNKETYNFYTNDYFLSKEWKFNNLNKKMFPTSGLDIDFNSKITIPGSSNKYYKLVLNALAYFPLNKLNNLIFLGKYKIGYGNGFSNKEMPFYDNFYTGGPTTIRGFKLNTIGPKAIYYNCDSINNCIIKNKSNDSVGGNAIAVLNAELIFPIPYVNSDEIRTSLFLDAGSILDTKWENTESTISAGIPDYSKINNIRMSTGISIKWLSPIGPIVFSYAKPIISYDGDKHEQFQFNIGKNW